MILVLRMCYHEENATTTINTGLCAGGYSSGALFNEKSGLFDSGILPLYYSSGILASWPRVGSPYHLHYFGSTFGEHSEDGARIVGRSFMDPTSNPAMCGIFFDEPDWTINESTHKEISSP